MLEIGTGSGYAAAILGRMAGHVYTVERHEELATLAARIRDFWRESGPRATAIWSEHQDIDDVMLAACLAPEGVTRLAQLP